MTKDEASRFQGLVARVNYLSLDRPDLQFAAKTASQHMAQPKVCEIGPRSSGSRGTSSKPPGLSKSLRGRKTLHKSQRTSTQIGPVTRSHGSPPAAARCSQAST